MTQAIEPVAADAEPAKGQHEFFRGDQIVVGLQYHQLLFDELAALGADPQDPEPSESLGLALIEFNASKALTGLQSSDVAPVLTAIEDGKKAGSDGGYDPSDLDLVVRGLRASFRDQNKGWVPTFGKNRIVGEVYGSHVIDGGGIGEPVPVAGEYLFGAGGLSSASSGSGPFTVPARGSEPGRGALVGLVDTALDAHPWLTGGFIAAAADLLPTNPASPLLWAAGHATFIAGLLLRQAPAAVVLSRSALGDDGTADSWTVANAIADLAGSGAQVINLSLGCYTDDGQPPLVLEAALKSLGPETVVVAACGNHGASADGKRPVWPAAFEDVIAVGALGDEGCERAPFTPDVKWLDAMAPGVNIVSTYPRQPVTGAASSAAGSGFATWSGTSFAAAAVSGEIASRIKPGRRTARQAWREFQQQADKCQGLPVAGLHQLGRPWDGGAEMVRPDAPPDPPDGLDGTRLPAQEG